MLSLLKKAKISQKNSRVKKILKVLSKKLKDFPKNSRIFQKTQCFGGYQPQLASKKLFNKQACCKRLGGTSSKNWDQKLNYTTTSS